MGSLVAELAEKLSSATNNFDIDEGTMYVNTSADTVGIGTTNPASKLDVQGTMQVGVNDTGHDVKFFGATAGAYLEWDESADELEIRGGAATPGKLLLSTAEPSVVDGNKLGQIDFQAPLDATGGTSADQRLVAASIWAEADATFSATVNDTDLVFATGLSETAAEKMRITSDGKVGIGTTAPETTLHVGNTASGTGGSTGKPIIVASTLATVYDGTSSNSWQGLKVSNSDGTSNRTATGITFDHRTSSSGVAAIMSTSAAADRGDLRFITRGSDGVNERMIIDDAGNVGIGISDPSHLLHVQQTAATGMGMLVVRNKNSDNSDSPLAKFHNDNISDDQTALHVRQDSPGYAIHVECNTDTTNYGNGIAISTQDENTTSYPLYIGTNTTSVEAGNARFVVRADGNVGIGTETPGGPLEIFKTGTTISSNAKFITRLAENNNPMRGISIGYLSDEQTGVIASATSAAASNLSFWVFSGSAWGERARINSAGNFNASNGDNAGSDYYDTANSGHVFHTNTDQRILSIENSHDSTPIGVNIDFSDADPNSNSLWYLICTDGSNNARCAIYSTGDVKNLNGTYTNFSDERLKTNISEASSQWDDIKTLNFKKYQLKQYGSDAPYHLGLIGQDVEKTSPHLVDETPANEYHIEKLGFKEGEMVKGLKQSILYMKGMVALQEAMARIETLETKVTALESA